jgi:pimeloyl-ACP methyl ester carboxylesterase
LTAEFHTEPFADAERFRAGLRAHESVFNEVARSEQALLARNPDVRALLLFGPSDRVIYPDFDLMAARVLPDHVGPFLLRDCGHFVPWEAAHAFVSAVAAFCGDLLAP